MPNRLIHESSPYLLQHANNPVDWYPWNDEALQKAKDEDKPILVSIGYSACHWCHVMEKESFENVSTAAFMNEHFINIKIDREERPDLDHIYMDAVQTMTGSGGWPLNVFLTPQTKPFYGGTYFPPRRAFNRASWLEVLSSVSRAFREKRGEIDAQAENLTTHLAKSNSLGLNNDGADSGLFSQSALAEIFQNLMSSADREWGGFGTAPKFPQTFSIQLLLRYYFVTHRQEALDQACLSLDKMIEGGIYDQVGGGFARYSTDTEWFVPHFEKMLYDNALLVSVLSEAYQTTKREDYKRAINETMAFVQRELLDSSGGFYAALDADSEGEEGKFYIWTDDEIRAILMQDSAEESADRSALFCEFFGVLPGGNLPPNEKSWAGKNLLRTRLTREAFAAKKGVSLEILEGIIQKGREALLERRNGRERPLLDDKIILGWNAMMNVACSKAFSATGNTEYRELAIANMNFLLTHLKLDQNEYFSHTWKAGSVKHFAFVDDYAALIQALIQLQEITGNLDWLYKARKLTEYVFENFGDGQSALLFFSDIKQGDLIVRKKELYDGATPSGNASMAYNAYQLSILFDIPAWRTRSEEMVSSLGGAIVRYPTSFGIWAGLLMEMVNGTEEVVVTGENPHELAEQALAEYIPHKVFIVSTINNEKLPLLSGKPASGKPLIYLCRSYSCLKPVSGVNELLNMVDNRNKN